MLVSRMAQFQQIYRKQIDVSRASTSCQQLLITPRDYFRAFVTTLDIANRASWHVFPPQQNVGSFAFIGRAFLILINIAMHHSP
jgi:hypothetical protein